MGHRYQFGWRKPLLALAAHYFEGGLSLCGYWGWPRWGREVREDDRLCHECYRAVYERRIRRTGG